MRSQEEIKKLKELWLDFDLTAQEREQLIAMGDEESFESFYQDSEFGTAGMRGIVGLGTNRLNRFNIRKATYALAEVSKTQANFKSKAVISYDSRLSSLDLVKESCQVLIDLGFNVSVFDVPSPTPLLSYAVRDLNCDLGIMMTASHNPLKYNGFKAYLNDGKQISPPYDQKVIDLFQTIKLSEINLSIVNNIFDHPKIEILNHEYYNSYIEDIKASCLNLNKLSQTDVKTVYTPLHGTGGLIAQQLMDNIGYKHFAIVPEQEHPDGNFPTTNVPNPENPKSLEYVVNLMLETNSDLAIGSDPDADRMGVAYNKNGKAVFLNGNEIANIMLYYKLSVLKERNLLNDKSFVISTIVSSPLQQKLCVHFGVKYLVSLTGFRWICDEMTDSNQDDFIFASEESYGSLTHKNIRDKDGISSLLCFIELFDYFKSQGKTIEDAFSQMYSEVGFFREDLLNIQYSGSEGKAKINNIMDHFFTHGLVLNGESSSKTYDFLKRVEINNGETKPLEFSQASKVLSFFFGENLIVHVRPSGTEPKIKFYIQMNQEKFDPSELDAKIKAIKTELEGKCHDL